MGNCNETPPTVHERTPLKRGGDGKSLIPEDGILDSYQDRAELEQLRKELHVRERKLARTLSSLDARNAQLLERSAALDAREARLTCQEDALKVRQMDFAQRQIGEANKKHALQKQRFEVAERKRVEEEREHVKKEEEMKKLKLKEAGGSGSRRWRARRKEGKGDEFVISAPSGFTHASHVGFNSDGSFDVMNAPEHLRRLLEKAGVQQTQLDGDTASFVFAFMNNYVERGGGGGGDGKDDGNDDAVDRLDALVPVPKAAAPPPPAPPAIVEKEERAEKEEEGEREEKMPVATAKTESLPKAPPAPPKAPVLAIASGGEAATSRSGDAFAAALQQKRRKLKQVDVSAFNNLSVEQEDSLAGALARALANRRGSIFVPADDDAHGEDDSDDEWSDE
jgi:P21-Rho-binding domain